MALSAAQLYMQQNPDVLNEYNRLGGTDWDGNKMTSDQFAEMHYNNHGKSEGRTWQQAALPSTYGDQTQAQYWSGQGAQPSSNFYAELMAKKSGANAFGNNSATDWMGDAAYDSKLIPQDFNWQEYAYANPDLAAAGADTEDEVRKHYALYGIQEGRQWKPAQYELGTNEMVTPGATYKPPVAPTQSQIDYTAQNRQPKPTNPISQTPNGNNPVGNGWGQVNQGGNSGGPAGTGWNQANGQRPQANLGMGYQPNPYLGEMSQSITSQVNDNLMRNIMPQLNSGAQSVGGFGGSRQGVLQANALKDSNQGLSNSLTSMMYGDYNNAMNRNLQQQGLDNSLALGLGNLGLGYTQAGNSYNLGLGNLALGNKQADNSFGLGLGNLGLNAQNANNNFYTQQRGQDLQEMGLGYQFVNGGNQGFLNQGQGIYNVGNTYQQAPWTTAGNWGGMLKNFSGLGGSTTASESSNPWANALGGAIGGAQLGQMF